MSDETNIVDAALDAGKALSLPIVVDESGREVVVLPEGYRAEAIEHLVEKYLPAPRRLKADVKLSTVESFIDYLAEHKTTATRIFVQTPDPRSDVTSTSNPRFDACIDFHAPGKPSWREHWARLTLALTDEWSRWTSHNGEKMSQVELAAFLETNQAAIQSPTGAELLELVQNLEGKCDASYVSAIRLANGKTQFAYKEDIELKGQTGTQAGVVDYPTEIVVALAPFEGGEAYRVTCRMRYRLQLGRITFWYEIVEPQLIIKDAVKGMLTAIQTALGIKPLHGQPG